MVLVIVPLEIAAIFDLIREEQGGEQETDSRADQNEQEEEEGPLLLGLPAEQDPPIKRQVQEQVERSQQVHPIDPHSATGLLQPAQPTQDASDPQGQHDRCKNREIRKRVHPVWTILPDKPEIWHQT